MYDQRRSTIAEERVAVRSISHKGIGVCQLLGRLAVFIDGKVHHVAGVVSLMILEAMLFSIRIQVRARGLEIGTVALGVLMKVDGVCARRQVVQLKFKAYARTLRSGAAFHYQHRAHALALGIFHLDHRLGRAGQRPENDHGQYGCNG